MKTKTHKCLALGCKQQVNMQMLMCTYHWAMVPGDIKTEVYATNMAPLKQGHITAMQKALKAVRDVESKKDD